MGDASAKARTAIVTGGARGIGRAIAEALAARGFGVAFSYHRSRDAADEVVRAIRGRGGRAHAARADLADAAACAAFVEQARGALGDPLVLVHNAGEMDDHSVMEMPDEAWERVIAIDLSAAMRLARACLPAMERERWGRIVCISSQAAFNGSARHAHYAAAKAGLHGFAYSLAKEVGSFGITVNLVAPGRIETDMVMSRSKGRMEEWLAQTPLHRLGHPEEVAAAVAFLVSEEASYITGSTLHVNGGQLMA